MCYDSTELLFERNQCLTSSYCLSVYTTIGKNVRQLATIVPRMRRCYMIEYESFDGLAGCGHSQAASRSAAPHGGVV